jgi:hypothetical protein
VQTLFGPAQQRWSNAQIHHCTIMPTAVVLGTISCFDLNRSICMVSRFLHVGKYPCARTLEYNAHIDKKKLHYAMSAGIQNITTHASFQCQLEFTNYNLFTTVLQKKSLQELLSLLDNLHYTKLQSQCRVGQFG